MPPMKKGIGFTKQLQQVIHDTQEQFEDDIATLQRWDEKRFTLSEKISTYLQKQLGEFEHLHPGETFFEQYSLWGRPFLGKNSILTEWENMVGENYKMWHILKEEPITLEQQATLTTSEEKVKAFLQQHRLQTQKMETKVKRLPRYEQGISIGTKGKVLIHPDHIIKTVAVHEYVHGQSAGIIPKPLNEGMTELMSLEVLTNRDSSTIHSLEEAKNAYALIEKNNEQYQKYFLVALAVSSIFGIEQLRRTFFTGIPSFETEKENNAWKSFEHTFSLNYQQGKNLGVMLSIVQSVSPKKTVYKQKEKGTELYYAIHQELLKGYSQINARDLSTYLQKYK